MQQQAGLADKQRDANTQARRRRSNSSAVKPGETVGELLPGGGYFTRLFSKSVGPKGHVYAWVPPRPANAPADMPDMAARLEAAHRGCQLRQRLDGAAGLQHAARRTPVDLVFTARELP